MPGIKGEKPGPVAGSRPVIPAAKLPLKKNRFRGSVSPILQVIVWITKTYTWELKISYDPPVTCDFPG